MTRVRWLARIVALGLWLAQTVVTAVRFGVTMAMSSAGGTLLLLISFSELIWPPKAAAGTAMASTILETTVAIAATGQVSARNVQLSGIGAAVGGGLAHGTVRVAGTAG